MTLRNLADQPFTTRCPPAQPDHVGRGAGLIDEDQTLGFEFGLVLDPFGTRRCNVRSILLGCAQAFFLKLMPWRSKNRQIELIPAVR
jgi:hypothetical protein